MARSPGIKEFIVWKQREKISNIEQRIMNYEVRLPLYFDILNSLLDIRYSFFSLQLFLT